MVVYSVLVKKYNNKVQKNEQNKFVIQQKGLLNIAPHKKTN